MLSRLEREGNVQGKTIYRDKDGKVISQAEKDLKDPDKRRLENEMLLKGWKGGVKQKEEAAQRKREIQEAES